MELWNNLHGGIKTIVVCLIGLGGAYGGIAALDDWGIRPVFSSELVDIGFRVAELEYVGYEQRLDTKEQQLYEVERDKKKEGNSIRIQKRTRSLEREITRIKKRIERKGNQLRPNGR